MHDGGQTMTDGLMAEVDSVISDSGILDNEYFSRLQAGQMSLESFRQSQQQFYFAVEYFSRPMSALLARIPRGEDRLSILENVVEEHGNFRLDQFHEATFRQFLQSIGVDGGRPEVEMMEPAVHSFNAMLMAACTSEDLSAAVACLGIVEYAFADISALIGKAVVKLGWVSEQELVHYKLHEEIDKQHAADFFRLIDPSWRAGQSQLEISQGLRLGAYAFDRLYRDLQ